MNFVETHVCAIGCTAACTVARLPVGDTPASIEPAKHSGTPPTRAPAHTHVCTGSVCAPATDVTGSRASRRVGCYERALVACTPLPRIALNTFSTITHRQLPGKQLLERV